MERLLVLCVVVVMATPCVGGEPQAEDEGFVEDARDAPYEIIPDYVLPGVSNEAIATVGAGVVGTLLVAIVAFVVARLRRQPAS